MTGETANSELLEQSMFASENIMSVGKHLFKMFRTEDALTTASLITVGCCSFLRGLVELWNEARPVGPHAGFGRVVQLDLRIGSQGRCHRPPCQPGTFLGGGIRRA